MLWMLVSIDAVNDEEYQQADVDGAAEVLDFVEECRCLRRFRDTDSLRDDLPGEYILPSEYGDYNYKIKIRCFDECMESDFLLTICSASYYPTACPEGFDPEIEAITVYEVVDSKEQISGILEQYWPQILEWRKSVSANVD